MDKIKADVAEISLWYEGIKLD